MILSTTEEIPGMEIVQIKGLVKGNAVRARHVGIDILAFFRNVVGGEIGEYTKMLAETREQALDRMIEDAEALGANAIVCVRFITSEIATGAAELQHSEPPSSPSRKTDFHSRDFLILIHCSEKLLFQAA